MKAIDIDKTLVDGYLRMLENLSQVNKLDLIAKLTLSIKADKRSDKKAFYKAFGAWQSKKSAEEIIADIEGSKKFSREIELF
jgi:hypothetical protein